MDGKIIGAWAHIGKREVQRVMLPSNRSKAFTKRSVFSRRTKRGSKFTGMSVTGNHYLFRLIGAHNPSAEVTCLKTSLEHQIRGAAAIIVGDGADPLRVADGDAVGRIRQDGVEGLV